MYFLLGICLIFAVLLALNIAASLAASVCWQLAKKPAGRLSARSRAQLIFAFRIIPLLSACLLIFAFLVPSYLLFEPEISDETVSLKLGLAAAVSLVGIVIALTRVFGTWWRTRRLILDWEKRGQPISIEEIKYPIYRFQHPFPVIAVVGIFRPRLFVAAQIFDLLETEEFKAAIVHEFGHLASHDNFKRTFLRVCRDLVIFPIGVSLERTWAETAEAAADEYALSTGGRRTAINLAAALVKIARVIPANTSPAMPLGAFLIDGEAADVSWRVRRLLHLTENKNDQPRTGHHINLLVWCGFGLLMLSVIWLATNRAFLSKVHEVMESLVSILQ